MRTRDSIRREKRGQSCGKHRTARHTTGGVLFPNYINGKNHDADAVRLAELVDVYIQNSTITQLSKGAYGITMRLELRSDAEFPPGFEPFRHMNPNHTYDDPVQYLVIKLCIISPKNTSPKKHTFNIDGKELTMKTVSETDFIEEINTQVRIFQKTYDYMQALCPAIVHTSLMGGVDSILKWLSSIYSSSDEINRKYINEITKICQNDDTVRIGIICMELVDSGETLGDIINHNINVLSNSKLSKQTQDRNINSNEITINIARFALLQLAITTGYTHADFHAGNIMIMRGYYANNYFSGGYQYYGRPMIIDFGRAEKIDQATLRKIKSKVAGKDYMGALAEMCLAKTHRGVGISDIAKAEEYYGWACGNYNISNGSNELDAYINTYIKPKIDKSVEKLETTYYNKHGLHIPAAKKSKLISDVRDKYKNAYLKYYDTLPNKQYINTANRIMDELEESRDARQKELVADINAIRDSQLVKSTPRLPLDNRIKNAFYSGIPDYIDPEKPLELTDIVPIIRQPNRPITFAEGLDQMPNYIDPNVPEPTAFGRVNRFKYTNNIANTTRHMAHKLRTSLGIFRNRKTSNPKTSNPKTSNKAVNFITKMVNRMTARNK